ncbi:MULTISPECIES: hypothetical protein [Bacillus cereus group]|uniref:Lipoprotein n=1 Tax=Bacillus thuringiensis serovar mexicanensis TaxID=180868 RepID=A0A242WAJ8_BACTU|nr:MULTISPECIES: hypothetical protein [Bacillus cereus group]EEM56291.1 hypothetical protein bthur0007_59110 [Bacillus thuringiensis serovar monterrey BGSC 4AJ1]MEB9673985.1 hypothetical protein [Bacillus anthracis]OTW50833.1 hypothetical protein BK699_09820 [Bacillus thuringiensis serovar mexicanensis]OTX09518.1 hypothetical protein BK705_04865 [Bacillus thuringiensis serovar monterrey]
MKMKKNKFLKIAANLGVSTVLLAGCVGDIEDSNTISEHDVNNGDSTKENKNCLPIDNKENKNECFSEMPADGPTKNSSISSNNSNGNSIGATDLLLPLATGYMLGNMFKQSPNNVSSVQSQRPTNYYKPGIVQQPITPNKEDKDKDKRSPSSAATSNYSQSGKSNDKVNLNKDNTPKQNSRTNSTGNSKTIVPNQSAKPSPSAKVPSGSSGIGNAKAPAGS